jgi:hypothetical protein
MKQKICKYFISSHNGPYMVADISPVIVMLSQQKTSGSIVRADIRAPGDPFLVGETASR